MNASFINVISHLNVHLIYMNRARAYSVQYWARSSEEQSSHLTCGQVLYKLLRWRSETEQGRSLGFWWMWNHPYICWLLGNLNVIHFSLTLPCLYKWLLIPAFREGLLETFKDRIFVLAHRSDGWRHMGKKAKRNCWRKAPWINSSYFIGEKDNIQWEG